MQSPVNLLALALSWLPLAAAAQPPAPPPQPPASARAAAQVDLTGTWVAQITEDWRWRMITPPKGDFASVPLSPSGREAAGQWSLEADNAAGEQCRAFGAGGVLRQPTRIRIAWADDDTLRLETDAGEQTRLFRFGANRQASPAPTWQGDSVAAWMGGPPARDPFAFLIAPTREASAARGGAAAAPGGASAPPPAPVPQASLKVVTTNLKPGYVRKNGVPYSDRAVVTEYFDRLTLFGTDYLQVVAIVEDPVYLTGPFTVSQHFKREPDDSRWHPTPCSTDAPVGTFQPPAFVL
jgi:hypothetical protein